MDNTTEKTMESTEKKSLTLLDLVAYCDNSYEEELERRFPWRELLRKYHEESSAADPIPVNEKTEKKTEEKTVKKKYGAVMQLIAYGPSDEERRKAYREWRRREWERKEQQYRSRWKWWWPFSNC